jgi:hypothetical protein
VGTIKKLEGYNLRNDELDNEMQSTKKKMQDQQRYIKELDERSVKLNNEYIQLLEKQNSGNQDRVNVNGMEEKVHTL